MKRLCIFLTYDKDKIIDKYIGYILKELKSCVQHLVVVCNMTEIVSGEENLKKYAEEIFYRENIGFDAGGFKEALCNYIGWDTVLEYDELILVNDSMFGPLRPMRDIFYEMENKKVDFWGLAKHGAKEGPHQFSEHIQSFFLVIHSKMLHSSEFRVYWEKLPFYSCFSDVVFQHEVKFTSYFNSLGYSYDVLADMEANDSKINYENNYTQYGTISYELIRKRNFPFLKKKQIACDICDILYYQTQENLCQAITYIDQKTDYDVDLIWKNIIRTLNMADLQRSLHLQYIVSPDKREILQGRKIAIVIRTEYESAVEYVLESIHNLSGEKKLCILVLSSRDELVAAYEEQGISAEKLDERRGNALDKLCEYDYVCVLQDADVTSDIKPSCIGKSYLYCIWENLFKESNHIAGILEIFEKEARLGFLAPPQPYFADYFGTLADGWEGNYEEVEEITKKLKLNCPISIDKPPFRVTNNFWIRGNILKQVKKLEIKDYKYLAYLWGFLAQDLGYYSGIIESSQYASLNEVNILYYLNKMINQVKKEYGAFSRFHEMEEKISLGALGVFCSKYTRLFIYGAGYYAKKYIKLIPNVEACIVSDDQKREESIEGIPILYLSEVPRLNECGIVLCLNKKNQEQVLPVLRKYGIRNYFCIQE